MPSHFLVTPLDVASYAFAAFGDRVAPAFAVTGLAPAAQARVISSRLTRSNWRTWPHRKLRKKVPKVEGALTTRPAPARWIGAYAKTDKESHVACQRIERILLSQGHPTMASTNELNDYSDGEALDLDTAASNVPDGSNQVVVRLDGAHLLFLGVAASGIIGAAAVFLIWWGLAERSQDVVVVGLILFFIMTLVWGATAAIITFQALKIMIPVVWALFRNKGQVSPDG